MVQLTTAATATVAVILAASACAAPLSNVEGTNVDITARSEHGHTHSHGAHHHHHAAPSRRDLDTIEDLDARFFRRIARKIFGREFDDVDELEARHEHHHHQHKVVERALEEMSDEELQARAPIFRRIARKIFGRDLDSLTDDLEARSPTYHNKVGNREMRRDLEDDEELAARFFFLGKIARKIIGREFDDMDELEARHEHASGHHKHPHQQQHLHKVVERALEEMSDEELQARAPIFRRIARKIFGRDLTEEDLLEARSPFFRKIARKIFGRELEDGIDARSLEDLD